MATNPTDLIVGFNLNSWETYAVMFIGIAIFAFFSGLGTEVAKYVFERWIRHRIDKVNIKLDAKNGELIIEKRKGLKHTGTRDIWMDDEEREIQGEWRR